MKLISLILFKYLVAGLMAVCLMPAFAQNNLFGGNRVDDESELKAGETMEGKVKNNFFLKAEVSKQECFVGETITAVFKAYSRLNSNSQVLRRPSLTGFSVLEMVDGYSNQPDVEKLNGKFFYAHLIRKVQLIPLQPGNFSLEGAQVESDVYFRRPSERDRGLSGLRNMLRRHDDSEKNKGEQLQYHVILETPAVSVNVKPLPEEGQPEDFSGAVGNFSVAVEMRDHRLRQNEMAKVKLTLKGSGNFPLVTSPEIAWPKGIEVSEPRVAEQTNRYEFPLSGAKTFEFSFEAKDSGEFVIPPISFSYFDPQTKTYKTEQTSPIKYSVAHSRHKTGIAIIDNYKGAGRQGFPLQWVWFGGVALVIIGWIVYRAFFVKYPKQHAIPVAATAAVPNTQNEIGDLTDQHLALAATALEQKNSKLFYSGIKQTIKEAVAVRCGISSADAISQNLPLLLRQEGVSEAVVARMVVLLNNCEWALFDLSNFARASADSSPMEENQVSHQEDAPAETISKEGKASNEEGLPADALAKEEQLLTALRQLIADLKSNE